MVDAQAVAEPIRNEDAAEPGFDRAATLTPRVLSGADGLYAYAELCRDAVHAPPQSAVWIQSWTRHCRPDFFVAALERNRQPVFALALEAVARGPFRVARFCGGPHANGNFPTIARGHLAAIQPEALADLTAELHEQRPDIDLLLLERQIERLEGLANPLARLPSTRSPNVALAADIRGGFEALLDRMNGARKRKKHRYRTRKFEAAGGLQRIEAGSPEEVAQLLTAFFAMKEQRFRDLGIADVFAAPEVRTFFQELFTSAMREKPAAFVLHGQQVGGKLRAVTGSSRCGERIICDFAGFQDDELAQYGPGEFLLYENIREACEQGYSIYDLGVGDEPYKRSWCDIETEHFDTILPLTAKGHVLAVSIRGLTHAKQMMKRNPLLWRIVKQVRKIRGGPGSDEQG